MNTQNGFIVIKQLTYKPLNIRVTFFHF